MSPITESNRLSHFLESLDLDPDIAGERLVLLREKLAKLAMWRGCPESAADEVVDIVIDRLVQKANDGVAITDLNAYAAQVLRYVVLEHRRKNKEDAAGDELPEVTVLPEFDDDVPDIRLLCLRKCLAEVVTDAADRQLILGYYDLGVGEKNSENRRRMAERLGMTPTNLKVKACRLRDRLERCISKCVS